jgi:hypothetical protein
VTPVANSPSPLHHFARTLAGATAQFPGHVFTAALTITGNTVPSYLSKNKVSWLPKFKKNLNNSFFCNVLFLGKLQNQSLNNF